jgi:hypothetical protein
MAKKNKPGKDAKKDDKKGEKKDVKAKVKKGAAKKPVAKKAAAPKAVPAKKAAAAKKAAPAKKVAAVKKAAPAKKAVAAKKPAPAKKPAALAAQALPSGSAGRGRRRSLDGGASRKGVPQLVAATPPELRVVPQGLTLAAGETLSQFVGAPLGEVDTKACLKLSEELVFSLTLSADPAVRAQQVEQLKSLLEAFLGSWESAAALITLGESCDKQ